MIDATGDGSVAAKAGVPFDFGRDSDGRVQTHGMVMGQGVETAAAMTLAAGRDLVDVDLPALQRQLRADGVYLEDVPRP